MTRRRRRTVAALVAGLLACLPACGGPDRGPDGERALLQAVLDRQAEAVLTGDRNAYLATVDPRADRYRAAQHTVFRNLTRLPLDQWSYRITATGDDAFPLPERAGGPAAEDTGDTRGARAPGRADGGAPRRIAVRAELHYRVRGYDTVPVRDVEYLTLTERKGRWYVSSDRDGAARGHRSTEQLWEQGEMTV
ncbi:MAG TPA: hypothetical protein VFY14_00325, partial [Streptomyces sp.]|nr:hypothetical protein [Streptomyces sp.]